MTFNSPLSFTGVLFLQMASAMSHSTVFVICGECKVYLVYMLYLNHIPGYLSVNLTTVQDLTFLQRCCLKFVFRDVNLLNTKSACLYIRTQCVPHSKHCPPWLYKTDQ
jgi:hypothetical protein